MDTAYAGKTYVYTYDNGGNILTKKTYAYTTGTLGTVQSTVNYGYGNSNWIDQLTSYNGINITYDVSGNPLNWMCKWLVRFFHQGDVTIRFQ